MILHFVRRLGFNGVRKHQKVEDPCFLALADEAGLMVWAEMPSAYAAGPSSAGALLREWPEVVDWLRPRKALLMALSESGCRRRGAVVPVLQ